MTGGPIYVDGGTMLRSSLGDAILPFTVGEEETVEDEGDHTEAEL